MSYGIAMGITHNGWELWTEEDEDDDRVVRRTHYAVKDNERVSLHGSPFYSSFLPTQERFAYLVDHGFPRASRGNWFNHEIDRLIEEEQSCPRG